MNLEDLRSVQRTERQKDSLQHLRDSFYEDVAAYVQELKEQREQAAAEADDPFASSEVRQLTDEIETAEEVVEAIYERRVGKVVKLASFAAADMNVDEEGMTTHEHALFVDLVERIQENKTTVLDILSGESDVSPSPAESGGAESSASNTSASDTSASEPPAADPTDSASESAPDPDDVLASAMGGQQAEQDDGARDEQDSSSIEASGEAGSSAESADLSDADRTPVDPEPAPPGSAEFDDAAPEPEERESETQTESDEQTARSVAPGAGSAPATASTEENSQPSTDGSGQGDPDVDEGAADVDRTTVRVTQDVGEIFGVDDREYDLASEDVVTLPTVNAEPLVERDAAERID